MNENIINVEKFGMNKNIPNFETFGQNIKLNINKDTSFSVGLSIPFLAIESSDPHVVLVTTQTNLVSLKALKRGNATLTATVLGRIVGTAAVKVW